jgi:antitoxin (DNA-binding transcriptional repressor) of toxin-antitoxin stability system
MFDTMKTMTTREFFHSPGIVKALRSGQSVVVTDNGKPALIVTKAGKRPRRSLADLQKENREIFPETRPKWNLTQALKELKTR